VGHPLQGISDEAEDGFNVSERISEFHVVVCGGWVETLHDRHDVGSWREVLCRDEEFRLGGGRLRNPSTLAVGP
jgi:hypothetical protein